MARSLPRRRARYPIPERCVEAGARSSQLVGGVIPASATGYAGRWARIAAQRTAKEDHVEAHTQEAGQVTGTKDKDYNIIWFVEQCLSNALRLETYIADAERDGDSELADFFRRAQGESRKGAEQGKDLLRSRIAT
jgi:hypothetical protein